MLQQTNAYAQTNARDVIQSVRQAGNHLCMHPCVTVVVVVHARTIAQAVDVELGNELLDEGLLLGGVLLLLTLEILGGLLHDQLLQETDTVGDVNNVYAHAPSDVTLP